MSLSRTDVEELKWQEEEGGWRTRPVDSQNATSNSSLLQTQSINRYVKLSCKAIE